MLMIDINGETFVYLANYWFLIDIDSGELLSNIGYDLVDLTTLH